MNFKSMWLETLYTYIWYQLIRKGKEKVVKIIENLTFNSSSLTMIGLNKLRR